MEFKKVRKNEFKNKIYDVETILDTLEMRLEEANKRLATSTLKIDDVENTLSRNAMYVIIVLLLIIFGLIGFYLFFSSITIQNLKKCLTKNILFILEVQN